MFDTVVFIKARVSHLEGLIEGGAAGQRVFVLDGSRDGLAQIPGILKTNRLHDLSAIHIVSHGNGVAHACLETVTP